MADQQENPPNLTRVSQSLSMFEIAQLLGGQDKLMKYVEPLISKGAEGGLAPANRDISGHIHTTSTSAT